MWEGRGSERVQVLWQMKAEKRADILKTGKHYLGRSSNVTYADSNSAFTEPNAEVTGSVSVTLVCGLCFTTEDAMEVHHWDGDRGNNRYTNLVLLHTHCHDQMHGKRCQ
jgi:5-methylcytosine-specific restriction endonuclease McrA